MIININISIGVYTDILPKYLTNTRYIQIIEQTIKRIQKIKRCIKDLWLKLYCIIN